MRNSTCHRGGNPDKSSGNTSTKSRTTDTSLNFGSSTLVKNSRKLRSGGLGDSNHMKAILVRASSDMEDGIVILGGKWIL
ncbi:hypothetical protein Tco_0508375 [Tanacetum coccineum]